MPLSFLYLTLFNRYQQELLEVKETIARNRGKREGVRRGILEGLEGAGTELEGFKSGQNLDIKGEIDAVSKLLFARWMRRVNLIYPVVTTKTTFCVNSTDERESYNFNIPRAGCKARNTAQCDTIIDIYSNTNICRLSR